MVPPGLSSPDASAASTILRAMRSFTEPPGLRYSTLARTVAATPSVTELSLTRGVFPTRSAMCSAYFTRPSSQMVDGPPADDRAARERPAGPWTWGYRHPWGRHDMAVVGRWRDCHERAEGVPHGQSTARTQDRGDGGLRRRRPRRRHRCPRRARLRPAQGRGQGGAPDRRAALRRGARRQRHVWRGVGRARRAAGAGRLLGRRDGRRPPLPDRRRHHRQRRLRADRSPGAPDQHRRDRCGVLRPRAPGRQRARPGGPARTSRSS